MGVTHPKSLSLFMIRFLLFLYVRIYVIFKRIAYLCDSSDFFRGLQNRVSRVRAFVPLPKQKTTIRWSFVFVWGSAKASVFSHGKTHRRRHAPREPFVPLLYLGFEAQYRTRYCTSNFFDYRSDSFSLFCARIFPFFSDFLCQFICQKICQPQHPKKRLRKPYKNESAGSQMLSADSFLYGCAPLSLFLPLNSAVKLTADNIFLHSEIKYQNRQNHE